MEIIDVRECKNMEEVKKRLIPAAKSIKNGDLVVIPTETVYGLAGDCFNVSAVNKIFLVKNRPYSDPLIVHISDFEQLKSIVKSLPEEAKRIMDNFWPGPVSLVLRKSPNVPDIVTAGLDTVCVRMPELDITREFITQCGTLLAAPSANIFSRLTSTELQHILKYFKDKKEVKYAIYAGRTKYGVESTVIDCTTKPLRVLRYGAVEVEKIARTCKVEIVEPKRVYKKKSAPGMMKKHYSPAKITYLSRDLIKYIRGLSKDELKKITFLCSNKAKEEILKFVKNDISVIPYGDSLEEIAQNLYLCLHLAEEMDTEFIVIQVPRRVGLGKTIYDRLVKASSNRWV
jgi:L-threonylcarbamoyladenylate synthase